MRQKAIIIITIFILLCISIAIGTIFLNSNNQQTDNDTNNTTVINMTNNTNDTNTTNTTQTTSNKKSTTSQSSKKQSIQAPTQRDDYIGEGGRNDYDYVSEEYVSNGHRYRDIHWYDGSVDKVQQD